MAYILSLFPLMLFFVVANLQILLNKKTSSLSFGMLLVPLLIAVLFLMIFSLPLAIITFVFIFLLYGVSFILLGERLPIKSRYMMAIFLGLFIFTSQNIIGLVSEENITSSLSLIQYSVLLVIPAVFL